METTNMLRDDYRQHLAEQPSHLTHIEKVFRLDAQICLVLLNEKQRQNSSLNLEKFYEFMSLILMEYKVYDAMHCNYELERRLFDEKIFYLSTEAKAPLSLVLALCHLTPYLLFNDVPQQLEIAERYALVIRKRLRNLVLEVFALDSERLGLNTTPDF